MRVEEMRSHGTALRERARAEVDTAQRLRMITSTHRRRRFMAMATTVAVCLAVVIVGIWTLRAQSPVATSPTTTIPPTTLPESRSIPVEVFVVLRGDYDVDDLTGACRGTGSLEGIEEGSVVEVNDGNLAIQDETPTLVLGEGEEVKRSDPRASFLLSQGEPGACVFALGDIGYDIGAFEEIALLPVADVDAPMGMHSSGQRVIYSYGPPASVPGADVSSDGVASDVPEVWQAEIRELRTSAGPGRIVGFVNLGGDTSTGAPDSPSQPVCVGKGGFADVVPGAGVTVEVEGERSAEGVLRGSAFDGHIGCSLWFGLDVPAADVYAVTIADHPPVILDRGLLDQFGWLVDIWADPTHMQANCVEIEPEAAAMSCVPIEEKQ